MVLSSYTSCAMSLDHSLKEKYKETQQLNEKLTETFAAVRKINNALEEISGKLPQQKHTIEKPEEFKKVRNTPEDECRGKEMSAPVRSTEKTAVTRSEGSSNGASLRKGKFEDILSLLKALDATFLAEDIQSRCLEHINEPESLPSSLVPKNPLYKSPIICNKCMVARSDSLDTIDSVPKPNSPVGSKEVPNREGNPNSLKNQSDITRKLRANSVCVKMNLIPRNSPNCSNSNNQRNKSTNAKQMRWGENTVIREENGNRVESSACAFGQNEQLPDPKYLKQKFKQERCVGIQKENDAVMSVHKSSLTQDIRDVLVELPPIPNDTLQRISGIGGDDFCGWFPDFKSHKQKGQQKSSGNNQVVKKTNRKVWFDPKSMDGSQECYYRVQGNQRLPHLYESAYSKFKSIPRTECEVVLELEALPGNSNEEDTTSLDLGEDLYGHTARSHLITLPIIPTTVTEKKRPIKPKLPPLKCTAVMKNAVGDPRSHWGESIRAGALSKVAIDSGKEPEPKSFISPVKDILKPLPVKEARKNKQLLNWCHKDVGPIKVPPLDLSVLDILSDSEPSSSRKEYLLDLLQKTPRNIENNPDDGTTANLTDDTIENDKKDKHFPVKESKESSVTNAIAKTSQQKMELPICMFGDKVDVKPLYHQHVRMPTELPKKEYRYRSDVPIDIIRLALKSKIVNKGFTNVNSIIQNFSQNTCKRSSRNKATRKSLKSEHRVKVCLEKDMRVEQELKKLRKQLKMNKRASDLLNEQLYGIDFPDTDRSGVARPSSPVTS